MSISTSKKAIVCGAGGFIGTNLVRRLKADGYFVRGVDLKYPEYSTTEADEFIIGDLRDPVFCKEITDPSFGEIYQLAADMGGAGYVFSGNYDADIMHNSASVNLNMLHAAYLAGTGRIFYSSSACIYPSYNLLDPQNPNCEEKSAYPAEPENEYGWEKLFSERLYHAYAKNYGMTVRIARFHNIYGPDSTFGGPKEKFPAAICRKVAQAPDGGTIEIWGDGEQTRSFLYVDHCVEGVLRLMHSDFEGPVNIGSEEIVTINQMAEMAIKISGKNLQIEHIPGPVGVHGRNSDNRLIREKLGWEPKDSLEEGLTKMYEWIKIMLEKEAQ